MQLHDFVSDYLGGLVIQQREVLAAHVQEGHLPQEQVSMQVQKILQFQVPLNFLILKESSSWSLTVFTGEIQSDWILDKEQLIGMGKFTMNEANWHNFGIDGDYQEYKPDQHEEASLYLHMVERKIRFLIRDCVDVS